MKRRTPEEDRRSGIRLIVIGVIVLLAMGALWWLDVTHNTEGDPGDPYLLPLLALIPLVPGFWRLHRAHARGSKGGAAPA